MPVLTPQVVKRNRGLNQYPPPPGAQPAVPRNSASAPTPQPPQFAPPPPSSNNYGVSGPPAPSVSEIPAGPVSPFQATGQKGAPIPGMTVPGPGRPNIAAGEPSGFGAPPRPPQPGDQAFRPTGATMPGQGQIYSGVNLNDDASYLQHVKGTIDSTISDAQWMAWKKHLDPGCPSNAPFRTERPGPGGAAFSGPDRCVEKPDNCPEGFRVIGNDSNGSAKCLPQGDAAFGGGGRSPGFNPAGPGGGGGSFSALGGIGAPGSAGAGGIDDALQKIIMGQLQNPVSRYTPEAMATLLSGTKATAEDQAQMERDAAIEDAASRGVLGAGATGTQLSNIRSSANRTVAGEQQNIARAKIDADYQDRITAIQQAQQYLDQTRDWLYKQQMRGDQRQQLEANIALAYARLQQDWDMLQANAGYGFLGESL